jgi:hypothetical protein
MMVFASMKRIDTGSGVPTQTPYRKSFGFAESFIGGSARTGTPRPSFCFLRNEKTEGYCRSHISKKIEVVEMVAKCERCVYGTLTGLNGTGDSCFFCKRQNLHVWVNEYMRCLCFEINPISFVHPEIAEKVVEDRVIEEYERERIP